ncbi:MAG: SDR family oxidoreductase [Candidatus Bathycorpusculaceae bacterium]
MSKVLVTGGAGFIGSHLVDKLLLEGYEVTVLDDLSSGKTENINLKDAKLHFVKGDVRDEAVVRKALKNVDLVFHLAAIIDVAFSIKEPLLVNNVNVDGSLNVLNQSARHHVEKFIFASSCAVYGEHLHIPIDEEHPTNPLSPYAASKLATEKYCDVFSKVYGLEIVCMRFFNVYGSRQESGSYGSVINNFINRLKQGKPPIIFGDGTQTRDFVYIDDVVDALFKAIHFRGGISEKINIGSGRETSIKELAEILIKKFGLKDLRPIYDKSRPYDIKRSCANIQKARRLLGYEPHVSLEDGLDRLLI